MSPAAPLQRSCHGLHRQFDRRGLLIALAGHVAVVGTLVYTTRPITPPTPPRPIFATLLQRSDPVPAEAAPEPDVNRPRPEPASPTASPPTRSPPVPSPVLAVPESAPVAASTAVAPAPIDPLPMIESAPDEASAAVQDSAPAPATPAARPGSTDEVRKYVAALMRELNRHKKYPRDLKKAKVEGTVVLQFTIDRRGQLIASSVQQSSGHAGLDQAAMDMLAGAAPLPPIPEFMNRDELALAIPVEYSLITDR
jgi:protein TonB